MMNNIIIVLIKLEWVNIRIFFYFSFFINNRYGVKGKEFRILEF